MSILLICALSSMVLAVIIPLISIVFQFSESLPLYATEPFECGFDPLSPHRSSFFVQFYVVGVVFVLFDIETMLMIPLLHNNLAQYEWSLIWLFLWFILLLGLLMEIVYGSIDWKEF
uniref:NADH-ubiquinone oxidoreductase chain 3 n=1 Tax=Hoplopleura kitti TaxID=1511644 RepID=A0A075EAP8_9NEOP|nr:NADH dehydrogenase subunit 3 [Hoplopleura kitti]